MITIVTTCKNRLSHLQQTLPAMVSQSFSEVIVVDYGCEQGTAKWVEENHPTAKVIRVDDDPGFCLSRARNIGAEHAQNEFLLFIDADTILNVDLGPWSKQNLKTGHFYLSKDRLAQSDLWGFVICERRLFRLVGGYDEAIREWGGEDKDLYERLSSAGAKVGHIPINALTTIEHGDDIRQLNRNELINFDTRPQWAVFDQFYRAIKADIQNVMQQEIDLENRKAIRDTLFRETAKAISEGRKEMTLTIDVPSPNSRIQRKLSYRIDVSF